MECMKCRKEISNESSFCNFCGEKVSFENSIKQLDENLNHNTEDFENEEKKEAILIEVKEERTLNINSGKNTSDKVKKKKMLVISSVVLTSTVVGYFLVSPYVKYIYAESSLKNKNYEKAIAAFVDLEDFSNSPNMVLESKYQYATDLLKNSHLDQAAALFQELAIYKDSAKLLVQSNYLYGKQLMDNKMYADAIRVFSEAKNYEDSEKLALESRYLLGKQHFAGKDYAMVVQVLSSIRDHADASKYLIEAAYLQGSKYYEEGEYGYAKNFFKDSGNYKDTKKYLQNISHIETYQGTWESKYGLSQLIFNGTKVSSVYFPKSHDTKVFTRDGTLDGDKIKLSTGVVYYFDKNQIIETSDGKQSAYTKISNHSEIPSEKRPPAIGMTAADVRNSNWGQPRKINKTTTAHGVNEQWVYDYKYIYLENGTVTSIQE
ncbi:tetratricopeptide repeat protein [Brevibacillus reuszeri]|uniref:tetratricopeptide repeat protein n=1 Tax=Brevibacillus reuszeri TaxID=54915 RepID=UPI003D1D136A